MGFDWESDPVSVNDHKVPTIIEASDENYDAFTSTDCGSHSESDIDSAVEYTVRTILLTLTTSDSDDTAIRKATD